MNTKSLGLHAFRASQIDFCDPNRNYGENERWPRGGICCPLSKTKRLSRTCNNCGDLDRLFQCLQQRALDGFITRDDSLAFDHVLSAIEIGNEAAGLTDHDDARADIPRG